MKDERLDPTVPKLQEARRRLAAMVERGECTQQEASEYLGKLADSLAGRRPDAKKQGR